MTHQTTSQRLLHVGLACLISGLLLACQPYLSISHPEVATETRAWQCPTATPVPTIIVGYEPTATPLGPEIPIYSTPVPTATPYIRTGSDYYLGQRIAVGPVIVALVGYRVVPGATSEDAYHILELEVENSEQTPIEIHFEQQSLLRTIRRPDGRRIEGTWYPAQGAAKAVGIVPHSGQWQPGTSRGTIVIAAPSGSAEDWGMPFAGTSQRRSGSSGDAYIWFRFRDDPFCPKEAGGPPSDSVRVPQPAGTPIAGRGGWPVPPGTRISRAYGCHSFYTGVRGNCGGGLWWHDGVDFANAEGTPLFAVRDVVVEYAGADSSTLDCAWISGSKPPHRGFGLYVRARDAQGYVYWYGHASSFTTTSGAAVPNGQQVGRMGSTGCSTGSHLHFRVRLGGVDRNPFDVIQER